VAGTCAAVADGAQCLTRDNDLGRCCNGGCCVQGMNCLSGVCCESFYSCGSVCCDRCAACVDGSCAPVGEGTNCGFLFGFPYICCGGVCCQDTDRDGICAAGVCEIPYAP
jgi:hypothetical protein